MIGSVLHPFAWMLRRPLKNDGGLSFRLFHLLSFLPMVQGSISTTTSIRSSFEQDYEYDKDHDVFLFYPSRPAFDSSRDHLFLPHRTAFYNLPVFRNDRLDLPLPLRPAESLHSDHTAVDHVNEDFYGREGEVLRSMGYNRCVCLGLISVSTPTWLRPAAIPATAAQGRTPSTLGNILTKLWNKFLCY